MTEPQTESHVRLATPGSDLRDRVETLGSTLAETLGAVFARLPRRPAGPQMLANDLGVTVVTASRTLKALAQQNPIAVLQLLPGPKPLRQILESAGRNGAGDDVLEAAERAVEAFDELIHTEAGNRSALKAMLTDWLPEERREFEAQRRQAIFKAMGELDGVSCELSLTSILLHPSAEDPSTLDVVLVECLLGIDRMRPDAVVKLGSRRLAPPLSDEMAEGGAEPASEHARRPTNLEGEPAIDGLHSVRLDEFCVAPPAPLEVESFGTNVQYTLGPTGFGSASSVDLVVAEVNRAEIPHAVPGESPHWPYYFTTPEMATRLKVFDLLVHRDVYPGWSPELLVYDTAGRGPAIARDPRRGLDLRRSSDTIERLDAGLRQCRLVEFPRYGELLSHALDRLRWDGDAFRGYRLRINYPLVGAQLTLAFTQGPE